MRKRDEVEMGYDNREICRGAMLRYRIEALLEVG